VRLAVRTPNWLGDVVMALPALGAVRAHVGRAPLAVAAPAALAPLFAAVPEVDVTVALPPDLAGEIAALTAGGFDAVLLLPNSFRAAWAAWRAGIPERWGYRSDVRGFLLTRGVPRPARRGREAQRHHAEYYLDLVRGLGLATAPTPVVRLVPPPAALARGRDLLRAHGADPDAPLVAFAPGAAYGHAKRWPATHFAALALRLWRARGVRTVLVGGAGDRDAALEIESRVLSATPSAGPAGPPVVNLVGRTDLAALLGVLVACRLAVSNDSGAMHVAAALGVPVVALFGPTDERVTAPLGPHVVLTNPVWCRPCLLRECPIDHRCLRGLDVERVWPVVAHWLDEPTRSR
jgi:heptosyltransferase-2